MSATSPRHNQNQFVLKFLRASDCTKESPRCRRNCVQCGIAFPSPAGMGCDPPEDLVLEHSEQWQYIHHQGFSYNLQPNLATRQKQLEAWSSLVLDYCQQHKIYTLDLVEAQQSPLFYNSRLNRKLPPEGVHAVLEFLEKRKHVEWVDNKEKQRCHIYWRTPEEWAKLIYNWVASNGLLNSVCTFYELTQGEDTANESFHGLEKEVLLKSLRHLQSQHKAELMYIGGNEGVKFF